MTEQQPNAEVPAPKPAGEQPAAARPARHGPPVAVAEEVLDERGQQTAAVLAKALGAMAVEKGGRDDIPWVRVEAKDLHRAAERCRDGELKMDMLHLMLAIDWVERIQMVYVLYSTPSNQKCILRADVPADGASIATVTDLWEAASWYEREVHDLFGVTFEGNDDLAPLLLYPEFEGHPGLKSYPLHDYQEF
jgi:NADH-quinone oxidoreductase subunit C